MKKSLIVVAVILFAVVAFAQDTPKAEIFGGYQYMNVDFKGGIDRQNFNGWDADVAVRINKNFSIVGDISGAYKTVDTIDIVPVGAAPAVHPQAVLPTSVKVKVYNYVFGPRVSFGSEKVTPFVEALFGGGHVSASESGVSISASGFAMAFGGGLDVSASKHIGIRLAKFDYVLNRIENSDLGLTPAQNLNNYRIATGIVFKF